MTLCTYIHTYKTIAQCIKQFIESSLGWVNNKRGRTGQPSVAQVQARVALPGGVREEHRQGDTRRRRQRLHHRDSRILRWRQEHRCRHLRLLGHGSAHVQLLRRKRTARRIRYILRIYLTSVGVCVCVCVCELIYDTFTKPDDTCSAFPNNESFDWSPFYMIANENGKIVIASMLTLLLGSDDINVRNALIQIQ